MKETLQVPAETKAKRQAAKAKARPSRKASAKRPAVAAAKRSAPAGGGYSDTTARFIAKGKSAFGDAYTWAGEAGSDLPRRVRGMNLPNHNSVQTYLVERPLVLGAIGLGLGMALGAMIPSRIGSWPAVSTPRRPTGTAKARRK